VAVIGKFRKLLLRGFLVDFWFPAPYPDVSLPHLANKQTNTGLRNLVGCIDKLQSVLLLREYVRLEHDELKGYQDKIAVKNQIILLYHHTSNY